jgi:hypothetical protein
MTRTNSPSMSRHTALRRAMICAVGAQLVTLGLAAATASARPSALASTALAVQSPTPARFVYGSDGRTHVEYDLLITNAFTAPVTLKRLQVRDDRRTLVTLKGAALAAATHAIFGEAPLSRIAPSATVETVIDVILPRSARRTVPRTLSNWLDYSLPANAPSRAAIGRTTVKAPEVRPVRRAPIVIESPVRGPGWYDANGCCADPSAPHRTTLLADNGSYVTPEIFAIDWARIVDGTVYSGDKVS